MSGQKALIIGIGGQDGSYMAELLLAKGYQVFGTVRRASHPHTERIDHLLLKHDERDPQTPLKTLYVDLSDVSSIRNVLDTIQPDEIYNLAGQSHVGISFQTGESTLDSDCIGPFRLLDTIKKMGVKVRYYQASSSDMFGASPPPQNESTPFLPQSPYAVAKVGAFFLTRMYRVAYGMFAANGILFNHESPRWGLNFVTRKITRGVASLLRGEIERLYLGNLDAKRDWGWAPDSVEAIWMILQQDHPDDFVIATGESHSIREFLSETFGFLGLDWQDFVRIDRRYSRPADVPALLGDASKAQKVLGWQPKTKFKEVCRLMLEHDLRASGMGVDDARRKALNLKAACPSSREEHAV